MKISFIGGGTMGEAIISSLLDRRVCSSSDISVSEPVEARRQYLGQKYTVYATPASREAVIGANVILMSVKPQSLPEVLNDLSRAVKPDQLVLSIMAGVKISTLRDGLQNKRIVRSMPNTPAQIGMGMTVWTATADVTEQQRIIAKTILSVMGKEIFVEDEKAIDMATAVSGSGPAYFFLFAEAITDAAANLGVPREMAKAMVLQTMLGSAHLIEKSGKEPAELRQMVTSKGGTTAAALGVFEEGDFRALVARAVEAAYKRARELGGEKV